VHPERRQQPDLAKLAAALIELATEQLNNGVCDILPAPQSGTVNVTSTVTTNNTKNTTKAGNIAKAAAVTPTTPKPSTRRRVA
jgi:hypothetical protein